GRGENDGAGTVAEEHAQVAPGRTEVHPGRVHLRTHEQNPPVLSRPDPRVTHGQAIEEAGALVPDVDRGHPRYAELALQKHAAAWKEIVGAERRVDDAVDLGRIHTRLLERGTRGDQREIGARLFT